MKLIAGQLYQRDAAIRPEGCRNMHEDRTFTAHLALHLRQDDPRLPSVTARWGRSTFGAWSKVECRYSADRGSSVKRYDRDIRGSRDC